MGIGLNQFLRNRLAKGLSFKFKIKFKGGSPFQTILDFKNRVFDLFNGGAKKKCLCINDDATKQRGRRKRERIF